MFSPNDQQYLGLTGRDGYAATPFTVPQGSYVSPALDMHMDQVRENTQWASDMKIAWALLKNEFETKGTIFGVLAKLEEKYQIRG